MEPAEEGAEPDDLLDRALALLRERAGLDLSLYKRATLRRRFARVVARAATTAERYVAHLTESDDGRDLAALATVLLVKTTAVVRHAKTFAILRERALPELFEARRAAGAHHVRSWVSACSTGEEAFGLAMALLETRERTASEQKCVVLGSDIDAAAIAVARQGRVPSRRLGALPAELRDRYFTEGAGALVVSPTVMGTLAFAVHDLLASAAAPKEAALATFDLVSCCNVLIYLEAEGRDRIFRRLLQTCRPGGILVLGEAESPPDWAMPGLVALDRGGSVFRVR